MKFIKSPEK